MQIRHQIRIAAASILAIGSFSLAGSAYAGADDYFLKFDGINGESKSKGHEHWIDLQSFNWGVTATAGGIGGGGSGAGKPQFSDFFWTQQLDSSLTGLFSSISGGKHIKNAIADFTTSVAGEAPVTYFKMTFDNVLLTSLNLSGSSGSALGLAGSFSYGKVTLDYWELDKTGKPGTHSQAWYDLSRQQGSLPNLSMLFARGMAGPQIAMVPEPETYALLLAGLGLMGTAARRRRKLSA